MWLGRAALIWLDAACRGRAFLDTTQHGACLAVENIEIALFAGQEDGGDGLAVLLVVNKTWLGAKVIVPDILVDGLEMPGGFAGMDVYGDKGCRKFVFEVGAVSAPVIDGGAAEREIDKTECIVARGCGPHVRRATREGLAFRREFGDIRAGHVP